MKICAQCKWIDGNDERAYCKNPKSKSWIDLVTGKRQNNYIPCSWHRLDSPIGSLIRNTCGRKGRWFEEGGKDGK